jgi:hypothetical protein
MLFHLVYCRLIPILNGKYVISLVFLLRGPALSKTGQILPVTAQVSTCSGISEFHELRSV